MSMAPSRRIKVLNPGHRYWVIGQARGCRAPFRSALDLCQAYWQPGDQFIFMGSQIGLGGDSLGVLADLSDFSAWVEQQNTAAHLPAEGASQVVCLRGVQEELVQRFATLHLAQQPLSVLEWMVATHGFDKVLVQFGGHVADVQGAAAQGAAALASYTSSVGQNLRETGVAAYMDQGVRAAVTDQGGLLFVHAGLDPARSLSLQTDAFWWGHPDFFRLSKPYQGFDRVISAVVPEGMDRLEGPGRLAFDSGCGLGGRLALLCLDSKGQDLFTYNLD